MASGLPVVCSDIRGSRDLMEPETQNSQVVNPRLPAPNPAKAAIWSAKAMTWMPMPRPLPRLRNPVHDSMKQANAPGPGNSPWNRFRHAWRTSISESVTRNNRYIVCRESKVKFFAPRQIQRRLFAALVTLSDMLPDSGNSWCLWLFHFRKYRPICLYFSIQLKNSSTSGLMEDCRSLLIVLSALRSFNAPFRS